MTAQHPITQAIRDLADSHEPTPGAQWYVDEHSIDVDAPEFWAVVDEAIRRHANRHGLAPKAG